MIDMLTNLNGEALKISDYLQIITLITVVLGGCFALLQWNNSEKVRKAVLMKELSQKIREDAEIRSALYVIDYGEEDWFTDSFLEDHETEAKFDKAFALFDYICYLKNHHILNSSEFSIFKYRIARLSRNDSFQRYLYNLYHFAKTNEMECSFHNLIKYMYRNNMLPKDFMIAIENEDTMFNYSEALNNSLAFQIKSHFKKSYLFFTVRRILDFFCIYIFKGNKL